MSSINLAGEQLSGKLKIERLKRLLFFDRRNKEKKQKKMLYCVKKRKVFLNTNEVT